MRGASQIAEVMDAQNPFTWSSSSRSDVGMVRDVNEDACLERPDLGLWAVADGMGGHSAGDVASRMIVETLDAIPPAPRLSAMVEAVERGLLEVNSRLKEIAARQDTHTIGSTVAAMLASGRHCVCLWAGDSRIYRFRDRTLEKLTQDHALVEELVEKGVLSREEAAHHPQGNLVTRAVGASQELYLDMEMCELNDDDVFILCSDGLDKEVEDAEIAEVIARENGADLSEVLVDLALSRGGHDNVTVVAVRIAGQGDRSADEADGDGEDTIPRYLSGGSPDVEEEQK